jgi:Alginate export
VFEEERAKRERPLVIEASMRSQDMPTSSTFKGSPRCTCAAAVLISLIAAGAQAQAPEETQAQEVSQAPEGTWVPPGLPSGINWTFNFDATFGAFTFGNSLYTDPKPDEPSGNLTANWLEGSLKPSLSATYVTRSSAEVYGAASAVGERTYGASPTLVGGDANSFGVEDMYIGWRSGNSLTGLGENALDFTIGRSRYRLGHLFLVGDGSSEGGTRGGYWTNARQAFKFAAIGRFKHSNNTVEAFYLEKDELPESDSSTKLAGVNYEYAFSEDSTVGATYMKLSANPSVNPERDGLRVYNLRAYVAPFSNKALSFEAEYAKEDNGALLDSVAWNFLAAWQLEGRWTPKISYRYALFEGDDPDTSTNESFDGLLTGFYDWGTWWQGEIAGEYFVSNSNLVSHQLRAHVTPRDDISMGLIYYDFLLDKVAAPGDSKHVANELDWYMDWSVNDNILVSFVGAWASPGKAVEASSGRTDSFLYGMVFVAYSF